MNVAQWLNAIDLGQYEAVFREHEIDAGVLRDLVEADLEKIGVPLGHRKRLLRAIAAIGTGETAAKPSSPAPASSSATAERRPITVMFCDLVGSTSMAAKLDAEDWRTLVNTYLDEASAAVTGLGGHVLKKLGDGLMALFGYPHAQENDAERAVRAALAIQRALVEINARNASKGAPELSARIGLDSGQVVVDATGEVFGDAPNIAARVQAAGEPDTVLVTINIQRQVAGLFVAEELGARELKGVPEPMSLFRIVRASGGRRRTSARTLTPFIGRENELSRLVRAWERVQAGEGQVALIVGEPGIGKSRLIEEFQKRLAEAPHTWVEWSASQLLHNTPLHPIIEWGRERFGGPDVPAARRLAELENSLRAVNINADDATPLLAPLLDIPLPSDRVSNLPPDELRQRQMATLVAWPLASARIQPIVLAVEDLHWADPTSLDLIRDLAERGAQAPIFVVATSRPEFHPPWATLIHDSVITLAPLDRPQVRRMVAEIASRHALSREVIEGVSERSSGVPLFVEEVTRLLLERDEQGGVQEIPSTLQQSLAARLDRLGAAREIAQIGAVLGRDFPHALLQGVTEIDEVGLCSSLERLANADILFVNGVPPQANYRFKHALIQDAAYESLLRSRRKTLHRRVAEILSEQTVREPEAIAHHFTQAGLDDFAIEWWSKAGDQALRRSAFKEAIAHLGMAIEMANKQAKAASQGAREDEGASTRRMKLQSDYGQAVMWSKGYAAEETKAAFAQAAELAARTQNAPERYAAYYGQWIGSVGRGELRVAREIAETLLREAEAEGRPTEIGVARRALGQTCFFIGDFVDARSHLERTIGDYNSERDREARVRFGLDTGAVATGFLAVTLGVMGDAERSRKLIDQATRHADELGHLPTIVILNSIRMVLGVLRGDITAVARTSKALIELSLQHGVPLFRAIAEIYSSWARGRLGDPEAGARELRASLAAYLGFGGTLNVPLFHGLLAELEARAQSADDALVHIDEGLALARRTGQHASDALLHRLRGDILLLDPMNFAPAEDAFQTAIVIARRQKARSLELQAALPLARLYQSNARPADACAVLAPALEGFSPTPELPQIAEAQSLLAALS